MVIVFLHFPRLLSGDSVLSVVLLPMTEIIGNATDCNYIGKTDLTHSHMEAITVLCWLTVHFSAKHGIAIACRLSVRPSVCDIGEL